jgi:fluoroacetyl-CoA thioesterase
VSELAPGLERSEDFTVEGPLTTDVGGTIGVEVLSTPGMIGMMERNASILAYRNLPEGRATVGFEVCIRHVGAAAAGATCTAHARLDEVADGRKLRFRVEVTCDGRTIGVGTHERRVVEAAAFGG